MEEKIIKREESIVSNKSMRIILLNNAKLKAYFIADNKDIKVEILHEGKNSESNVVIKGLNNKNKEINLIGTLIIKQEAHKSKGRLIINGLNINGGIKVLPAIENYEKDSIAEHSASIQDINKELLFYLQTRGFGKKEALSLIIKSFLTPNYD